MSRTIEDARKRLMEAEKWLEARRDGQTKVLLSRALRENASRRMKEMLDEMRVLAQDD